MNDRSRAPARATATENDGPWLERLLSRTSRTFALSIPVLPDPTRREVTVAYLLFRVADTLEDATAWPRARKLAALERLAELLPRPERSMEQAQALAAEWGADPPTEHAGYRELLGALPLVLAAHAGLERPAREQVARHTLRTIEGMSGFVSREAAGLLELRDLADLRAYCYVVAGIVGELLTELFVAERRELAPAASALRADAAAFGEALQLVNILKDSASDRTEGRSYLPAGVAREAVFDLAWSDLGVARSYALRLWEHEAPRGIVEFTMLPALLARATLRRLQSHGPGSKISRAEVQALVRAMHAALDAQQPDRAFATAGTAE